MQDRRTAATAKHFLGRWWEEVLLKQCDMFWNCGYSCMSLNWITDKGLNCGKIISCLRLSHSTWGLQSTFFLEGQEVENGVQGGPASLQGCLLTLLTQHRCLNRFTTKEPHGETPIWVSPWCALLKFHLCAERSLKMERKWKKLERKTVVHTGPQENWGTGISVVHWPLRKSCKQLFFESVSLSRMRQREVWVSYCAWCFMYCSTVLKSGELGEYGACWIHH